MVAESEIPQVSMRRNRLLALLVALACILAFASCGSDDTDDPVVSSLPNTTEAPAGTQAPPSSGQEPTPSTDSGMNGADPGRDAEKLNPPGGTTPVPNPGGASDGSTGQGVNPDTDRN
ncbi:MAG: hypothetical protein WBA45_15270 [Microthrixaceae bacterium]